MKREIALVKPGMFGCCPGHDEFPDGTYRNRRSKKARARDKAKEHRFVRRKAKLETARSAHLFA